MECRYERGKTEKNIEGVSFGSEHHQFEFSCPHTVDISSRKSFPRKTSHNLLDLRGGQDSITREINRRLLQGLSELRVSEMHVHPSGESLSSSDFTNRQYEDGDFGISIPEIENSSHRRRKRSVKFNMDIQVLEIPYEDRTSEWMTLANDRFRFQRRILQTAIVLEPMLKRHLLNN